MKKELRRNWRPSQRKPEEKKKTTGLSPIVHENMNQVGQQPEKDLRTMAEPSVKHNFSRVNVYNNQKEMDESFIYPKNKKRNFWKDSVSRNIYIAGSPEEPLVTPTENPPSTRESYSHPFTAQFLMASGITADCGVPEGHHGVAKVAKFRIMDSKGQFVKEKMNVKEKFKKLDGPDELFKKLVPNSYIATNSYFDDCYRLFSSNPLPSFTLKVEQNHFIGDEIISKNHIIYSPSNILICVFPRVGKGFGAKCKFY